MCVFISSCTSLSLRLHARMLCKLHSVLDIAFCDVLYLLSEAVPCHVAAANSISVNREVAVSSREERRPCFLVSPGLLQNVSYL